MLRRAALLALVAFELALPGCSSSMISVDDYVGQKPEFVLKDFFTGKLVAKGALYDRSGAVTRRFTADIAATWDGDRGRLDEVFQWADGERQLRTWQLEQTGDNRFTGTADDVVGTALGRGSGNAFNWNYTLRVDTGGREVDVRMDDWIHLIEPGTVLNRTEMTWYGIRVGEVVLVIERVDPTPGVAGAAARPQS